ncbi:beta-galactosidase-like isoform X2 [Leguminivora glycinivorella]|uniref:beta-galactosidase-like isoform X2 n=1 Tax=Leguminivora glycinivorella TaxID=1035111 RepID=UPI0020102C07|nr:beta-galactosidase-like isoform X2 [Leguminivora glycinivorella]
MRLRNDCRRSAALWICCLVYGVAQAECHASMASEPSVVQVKSPESTSRSVAPSSLLVSISNPSITIVGDNFAINGEPFQIKSGSLHYFRVPAVYWKDRLHKLKAAGLNAVSTYVEWSFHEPEERQYSFEGDRDVAAFVRLAAEEGLHVLLRPGPYICAERDLGGLPYWLLGKYPQIRLRSTDEDFIAETKIWLEKLFEQLKPLLFGNGGPIILVQVENEYGSYGSDMEYKVQARDIMLKHVGDKALLYTTDGTYVSMFQSGAIPNVLTTIDFGATSKKALQDNFKALRSYMPHGPLMNSEFYPGWLTHWGETFKRVPTAPVVATLEDMLNSSINFNIYVFFGGTNFEFTAGANYDGTYTPDITSYDYDAPISESGDLTTKYFAIREVLARYDSKVTDIDPPSPSNASAYGKITLTKRFGLLSTLGRTTLGKRYPNVVGSKLPTFEKLRQRSGLMLYEISPGQMGPGTLLEIAKPRDRIHVFVDGRLVGILSRTKKLYSLPVETESDSVLSLLVENQGRINYGNALHDFKGILSKVYLGGKVLSGNWSVTGFPLENLDGLATATAEGGQRFKVPMLFDGYFTVPENEQPQDTFFDPTSWGKGFIWVNGHNLGRYWPGTGPQVTLYVPGCWLRAAPHCNHVQVLELDRAPVDTSIRSILYPILNRTVQTTTGSA